jgi:hypothetical protein
MLSYVVVIGGRSRSTICSLMCSYITWLYGLVVKFVCVCCADVMVVGSIPITVDILFHCILINKQSPRSENSLVSNSIYGSQGLGICRIPTPPFLIPDLIIVRNRND